MKVIRNWTVSLLVLFTAQTLAQGQDSTEYERDLQVISTMLPGRYDNMNQFYFDRRGKKALKHSRIHTVIEPAEELGAHTFAITSYLDNDESKLRPIQVFRLKADDDTQSVRMRSWNSGQTQVDALDSDIVNNDQYCDVFWTREAAQFRATGSGCEAIDLPGEYVLSEPEFWMNFKAQEAGNYELHRAREMGCYADIPGVGGGRDEPYERYDDLRLHDQGGQVWFDAKDGRRLGISVFLVDWPINNYEGIFTRDSLVIYVSEQLETERKEHGYAFTVPEADRIGINLKWMLAACFMQSNQFAMPEM